jgi:hypothetical protein
MDLDSFYHLSSVYSWNVHIPKDPQNAIGEVMSNIFTNARVTMTDVIPIVAYEAGML